MTLIPLPQLVRKLSAERGDTSMFVLEITQSKTARLLEVQTAAALNDLHVDRAVILAAITAGLRTALEYYESQSAALALPSYVCVEKKQ